MLEINLSGLKLKSPIILASGILGVSYSSMKRIFNAGAGAVTSKSIGPRPRKGYKNPSILEIYPGTFLNAVGLGNPGIDNFITEIREIKKEGIFLLYISYRASEIIRSYFFSFSNFESLTKPDSILLINNGQ